MMPLQLAKAYPSQPMGTVLLVEDDPDSRDITAMILERAGFRVSTAADGEEALKAVARSVPDLLVLDLRLPRLDGWSVLRSLRRNVRFRRMPRLVLSASVYPHHRKEAELAGCDAFVPKPLDVRQFIHTAQALVACEPRYARKER